MLLAQTQHCVFEHGVQTGLLRAARPGVWYSATQHNAGAPTFPSAKRAWLVGCGRSSSRQQTPWATLVVVSGVVADTYPFVLPWSDFALLVPCLYVITQITPGTLPCPARCSECLFCPSRVPSRQTTAKTSVIPLWVTVGKREIWVSQSWLKALLIEIFESHSWGLQRASRILP